MTEKCLRHFEFLGKVLGPFCKDLFSKPVSQLLSRRLFGALGTTQICGSGKSQLDWPGTSRRLWPDDG